MPVNTEILNAFFVAVNDMSLSASLPVAYPNVLFNPPDNGKYLECIFIPFEPVNQTFDGIAAYTGIFRIGVYWPSGEGEVKPMAICDEIAALFPFNTKLTNGSTTITLTKQPSITTVSSDARRLLKSVNLTYLASN